jgi:hypothetical protein
VGEVERGVRKIDWMFMSRVCSACGDDTMSAVVSAAALLTRSFCGLVVLAPCLLAFFTASAFLGARPCTMLFFSSFGMVLFANFPLSLSPHSKTPKLYLQQKSTNTAKNTKKKTL